MFKYPRTPHLEGSCLQLGDSKKDRVSFSSIKNLFITIEEKVDGANSGISFTSNGDILLQSRGHYLTGGARERQFGLLKQWGSMIQDSLYERLTDRYVMYGEWMFAKHTVFYDKLPHYFLEFDILDTKHNVFLSTDARAQLLDGLRIVSVPVIGQGQYKRLEDITRLVGPSLYKSETWRDSLALAAGRAGVDEKRACEETEKSDLSEGIYIKIEEGDKVVGRLKWVRSDFMQSILDSGSHWQDRPLIQNGLSEKIPAFYQE